MVPPEGAPFVRPFAQVLLCSTCAHSRCAAKLHSSQRAHKCCLRQHLCASSLARFAAPQQSVLGRSTVALHTAASLQCAVLPSTLLRCPFRGHRKSVQRLRSPSGFAAIICAAQQRRCYLSSFAAEVPLTAWRTSCRQGASP